MTTTTTTIITQMVFKNELQMFAALLKSGSKTEGTLDGYQDVMIVPQEDLKLSDWPTTRKEDLAAAD